MAQATGHSNSHHSNQQSNIQQGTECHNMQNRNKYPHVNCVPAYGIASLSILELQQRFTALRQAVHSIHIMHTCGARSWEEQKITSPHHLTCGIEISGPVST